MNPKDAKETLPIKDCGYGPIYIIVCMYVSVYSTIACNMLSLIYHKTLT